MQLLLYSHITSCVLWHAMPLCNSSVILSLYASEQSVCSPLSHIILNKLFMADPAELLSLYNGAISFYGMQRLSGNQLWRYVKKFKNYRSQREVYFCMSTCGASYLPLPPPQHWSIFCTTLLTGTRPKKTEQLFGFLFYIFIFF